jgi:hypothetical protein
MPLVLLCGYRGGHHSPYGAIVAGASPKLLDRAVSSAASRGRIAASATRFGAIAHIRAGRWRRQHRDVMEAGRRADVGHVLGE